MPTASPSASARDEARGRQEATQAGAAERRRRRRQRRDRGGGRASRCPRDRRGHPSTFRCPSGSTTSTRVARVAAIMRRFRGPRLASRHGVEVRLKSDPDRLFAMTYAIIKVAGKQYRVREGERLLVDRLHEDDGATFAPTVLLVGGDGGPQLDPGDGVVTAKVLGDDEGAEDPDREVQEAHRLSAAHRLPRVADADPDRVDRRRARRPALRRSRRLSRPRRRRRQPSESRRRAREGHAVRLRGHDRRRDQGRRRPAGTGRCSTRRSSTSRRTRSARARSPRSSRRSPTRRVSPNGAQEGSRLLAQRSRLRIQATRREDLRRAAREDRDDHRPPARHEVPPRPRRRPRSRRHDLRAPRRNRRVPPLGRQALHLGRSSRSRGEACLALGRRRGEGLARCFTTEHTSTPKRVVAATAG